MISVVQSLSFQTRVGTLQNVCATDLLYVGCFGLISPLIRRDLQWK